MIKSILAIFWFGIWCLSFMGMIYFIVKDNITYSTISGIVWGMGWVWLYVLVWRNYAKDDCGRRE
jgi:hypothetical protein